MFLKFQISFRGVQVQLELHIQPQASIGVERTACRWSDGPQSGTMSSTWWYLSCDFSDRALALMNKYKTHLCICKGDMSTHHPFLRLSAHWPLAWVKHSFLHPVRETFHFFKHETTKGRPKEEFTAWTDHFSKVLWLLPATYLLSTELWSLAVCV